MELGDDAGLGRHPNGGTNLVSLRGQLLLGHGESFHTCSSFKQGGKQNGIKSSQLR